FAEVDAGHDEADRHRIKLGDQRDAHTRFGQRIRQLALKISGPVAAGNPSIDRHQRTKIAFGHRTHRYPIARERSVIRGGLTAVIDLGGFSHVLRERDAGLLNHAATPCLAVTHHREPPPAESQRNVPAPAAAPARSRTNRRTAASRGWSNRLAIAAIALPSRA